VQISFVKSNLPEAIFSISSSDPTTSAPAFLASSVLSGSHKTATLLFFPEPLGKLTTVLKLKSPPLDCFKLIFKDTSIDSSNLVVEFFLTRSRAVFGSTFLSLITFLSKIILIIRLHNIVCFF